MDTDDLIIRARQNCCRLCLAPDSECVPIFDSLAADKEPISRKIQTCVDIKITQTDRLSSKICHFCISYLNSWQSFKNRCIASQTKQQYWLEIAAKNYLFSGGKSKKLPTQQNGKSTIKQNTMSPSVKQEQKTDEQDNNLDEPIDKDEEGETLKIDIDPTEFLVRHEDDDDDDDGMIIENPDQISQNDGGSGGDGPSILTSLGLTHITSVNPYSFLSTELGQQDGNQNDGIANDSINDVEFKSSTEQSIIDNLPIKLPKTLSSCSICKLSFSTRANARRHERNIHGKIINSIFGGRKTLIKKSQVTPEMMGIYDYDKPEKYRHLLTEQKLLFIRKNEIFLKQYQTLTCNCCSKTHPTYKNFMAHMRKKFPTLARNLCFKCLKQFPTKALFVSHLKKKCCINLYKLYLTDDTIPKDVPLDNVMISPEKMGAKDLLTNKVYVCKLCTKTCRLKVGFRSHVNEDHSDVHRKDLPPGHCGFCGIEIEDPVERKRHYNNMECIVSLRCVTCDEEFENHQTFIDHVYEAHLPNQQQQMFDNDLVDEIYDNNDNGGDGGGNDDKNLQNSSVSNKSEFQIKEITQIKAESIQQQHHIDSRSPQSCKICGQHYNNYNNVLRHMEAKHPDQLPETYKCTTCNIGFARMSMLREHMLDKHGKKVPKYTRRDTTAILQIFACKICSENFKSIDKWILHQLNIHSYFICCQCNFQNKNIDEFKKHIEAHPSLMQSKISGITNTNTLNLNNSNTNTTSNISGSNNSNNNNSSSSSSNNNRIVIQQSTNDTKESTSSTTNRFDYIMKDVLEIRNGIKLHDEKNSEGNVLQSPPQKKIKLDVDLKECQICHALFNSSLGLSNHMRIHSAHRQSKQQQQQQQQQQKQQQGGGSSNDPKPKSKIATTKSQHTSDITRASRKMYFGLTPSDLLRRIRCRLCQKRFSTKKGYRKHMLLDHQINNVQFIKCTICNSDFTHEKGLKFHMLRAHDKVMTNLINTDLKYECDECEKTFKTEDQLSVHRNIVHNTENEKDCDDSRHHSIEMQQSGCESSSNSFMSLQNLTATTAINNSGLETTNLWFQCRYCPANFDTNKKLAIHTNSHDEYDSNDYSCKDCGNVYSGRKSLWVHRYKKHPLVPHPSLCKLCNKQFFDKNMLELHMRNYSHTSGVSNRIQMSPSSPSSNYGDGGGSSSGRQQNNENLRRNENDGDNDDGESHIKKELSDDDDDDEDEEMGQIQMDEHGQIQQVPEVRCTMCNLRFTDVESFTKHMNMHEMELYTDNPLAAMFDTGPDDPNKFYESRLGENGEYVCDICPKTFSTLTSFKVHRNWHFRSDGKQIPADPNTTWRGVQRKKKDPATSVKCKYCNSLFINENNLKRHIMELHKREISSNGQKPKVFIEKNLECKRCEMKFRCKSEWILHKLDHVKNETLDLSCGWGCEICGKIVSRKERLVQHVKAHLKDDQQQQQSLLPSQQEQQQSHQNRNDDDYDDESNSEQQRRKANNHESGVESNSQDSNSMSSTSGVSDKSANDDDDDDEDDDEEDSQKDKTERKIIAHVTSDGPIMRPCDNEEEEDVNYYYEDDNDNENDGDNENDELNEDDDNMGRSTYNSDAEEEENDEENRSDAEHSLNETCDDDDEDDDDDDDEEDVDDRDTVQSNEKQHSQLYSCDLCNVNFTTSKELQSHVTSHFLSGPGSVTLTKIEKKSDEEMDDSL